MNKVIKTAVDGKLLASVGKELRKGIWESCVYLGTDGFVYYIEAARKRADIDCRVIRKNAIGEYLRWVDDIHSKKSGQLPSQDMKIHLDAAWTLREII
jgi:hypothetical protein